jgi:hypothetical protein
MQTKGRWDMKVPGLVLVAVYFIENLVAAAKVFLVLSNKPEHTVRAVKTVSQVTWASINSNLLGEPIRSETVVFIRKAVSTMATTLSSSNGLAPPAMTLRRPRASAEGSSTTESVTVLESGSNSTRNARDPSSGDSEKDPKSGFESHRGAPRREDDNISIPSTWSETSNVPKRSLGYVQITSLMINCVIGTGIFTTPGLVLFLTQSKAIALGLWGVGGVYLAISYAVVLRWLAFTDTNRRMVVIFEYGSALPYNGGAMIYVCPNLPSDG